MILLIHREAVEKNPEKYPLNSNLILLILMSAALTNNNATCFKFQSDSINTIIAAAVLLIPKIFKFQSDFINTSQTTTS